MKVALYARVSSKDQTNDRQTNELKLYAAIHGWEVVEVISEKLSGTTTSLADRPGITRLLALAEHKEVEKVLVSEVSRIGRRTQDVLEIVEQLHARKVGLFVLNYKLDTLVDGKVNSMAQFWLTLLADIARMETATLSERILSGLASARLKGKKLGRKKGTVKSSAALVKQYKQVVKLLGEGQSQRNTAKIAGVSYSTVQRVAAALKK